MVALPVDTPVISPVVALIVATPIASLLQVPPATELLKVVVAPTHTKLAPDTASGKGSIVTVIVVMSEMEPSLTCIWKTLVPLD